MSYTALYRKFRPSTFEDVKGQDHIVTTLKNQIRATASVMRTCSAEPADKKNDDRQDSRPLGQLRTSRGRKPVQRMSDV